ncbi:histidine kinase [Nonomuraea sp. NPDC003804]|uniref:sensor histidine kinase n=1 Tax=Nonomuraea sp. NPDC003804 TaxID=3154547 RepID=UPI0033B5ABA0
MGRIPAARRWFAEHPRVADVMLAAALTTEVLLVRVSVGIPDDPGRTAVVGALLLAQAVPLLWRRSRAWLVMAVVSVAYMAFEMADPMIGFRDGLSVGFAVYAVARYTSPPASLAAVGAGVVVVLAPDVVLRPLAGMPLPPDLRPGFVEGLLVIGLLWGVWLLGSSQRHIRADAATLLELTARLRAEQEVSAARAVTAERSRIARDLHDLVAHHVSAIAMQARVTAEVLTDDPELAGRGMAGIGTTADTALLEMRRMLKLLADDEAGAAGPLSPEPSLRHLHRLASAARAAGGEVEVSVEIGPDGEGGVPPAVQVSACRVVQEALTNVLKHAGPTSARVEVRQVGEELVVMVANAPGPPGHVPMTGSGLGLIGMRERVALFGGTLSAGPLPDGGWQILATFRWEGAG